MLKTVVLLSGILALAWSQSTPVSECVRNQGQRPINTYIENCSSPPCQLPQLQDVVVHIVFKAPYTMRSMTTLATAYLVGPLGIPYALGDQASTCNFLTNTYCPVLKDEVVTYTLRMYIESFFPQGTSVNVEFRIVDENSVPVVCIRVPIAIVAPIPSAAIASSATNATLPMLIEANVRRYFTPEQLLTLYKAQVRSCMEYCSHVWDGSAKYQLEALDSIEKRAKKLIGDKLFIRAKASKSGTSS